MFVLNGSLGNHCVIKMVTEFTFITDNENFGAYCDRRFFSSFSVCLLLLQNVVEVEKSLLVVDVIEETQKLDTEMKSSFLVCSGRLAWSSY